jgi:hypothetical protein
MHRLLTPDNNRLPAITFIVSLLVVIILSVWLIMRMVINTDPTVPANVAVVLLMLFLAGGSLTSLLSWAVVRRALREDRYAMSLRHGVWGGLFLISLPLLRWLDALSVLVVSALLLIILGLESLLLLQPKKVEEEQVEIEESVL